MSFSAQKARRTKLFNALQWVAIGLFLAGIIVSFANLNYLLMAGLVLGIICWFVDLKS